jgi:hypothetical protein
MHPSVVIPTRKKRKKQKHHQVALFFFYQRERLTFSFVADKSGVHFSWANVIKVARILSPPIFMRASTTAAINSKIGERPPDTSAHLLRPKSCQPRRTPTYIDAHWL